MKVATIAISIVLSFTGSLHSAEVVEIPAEELRDKIRGGLLGQMLGNLNGLQHELRYNEKPGNVKEYNPGLPEGAWTDDDTDFEWVYIVEMQRQGEPMLSSSQIAHLWRERINRRIWCSNQYARQLMDLEIEPPLTGSVVLNPWAEFNISGQFLCETFGLIAPAMPQTASRIGLNYTSVAIEGEPAQTTQFFTTMIATAFVQSNIDRILDAGMAALDKDSEILEIAENVRQWHATNPDDWRATRRLIMERYARYGGSAMRDRNGYELNTAGTVAALLYGKGDFRETLRIAFNFGWDCDNTAATSGTIIGVTKGYRWMLSQGWPIVDRYRNTTRENMPKDETISSFADRLIDLAELVIIQNGGRRQASAAKPAFAIKIEPPEPIQHLASAKEIRSKLRTDLKDRIIKDLTTSESTNRARAAYLAVCLELNRDIQKSHPQEWSQAIKALQDQDRVMQVLFHHSAVPAAGPLRKKFVEAGIEAPKERKPLW